MLTSAKYKFSFLLLICLAAITLLVNSCKKSDDDSVDYFLTYNTWTLASVQVLHYVGDTQGKTDTLNTSCTATQTFKFNSDNTCTYTNYHCLTQTSTGTWSIADDKLTLHCNLVAQDTSKSAIVKVNAFSTGVFDNVGHYSLVIKTGDIQSVYKSTTVRTIYRYGFVHANN